MAIFSLEQNIMKIENMSLTNYSGSQATRLAVYNQIKSRWGDKAARKYDAYRNCRTFKSWRELGLSVAQGQRALKSVTYVPIEDNNGKVVDCYKRTVNLFYYKQLERVIN